MDEALHIDHEIDTRGQTCPLPILKMRRGLAAIGNGALARVRISDPESARDAPDCLRRQGHELLLSSEADGEWTFVVRAGMRS